MHEKPTRRSLPQESPGTSDGPEKETPAPPRLLSDGARQRLEGAGHRIRDCALDGSGEELLLEVERGDQRLRVFLCRPEAERGCFLSTPRLKLCFAGQEAERDWVREVARLLDHEDLVLPPAPSSSSSASIKEMSSSEPE